MTEEKKQEEMKEKKAEETKAADEKAPETQAEEKKEDKESSVTLTDTMKQIISLVEGMSVLELADLVKALEEKFGVSAAAPVVAAAAVPGAGAAAAAAEEKTSFNVVLASAGSNKIQVIKEVRAVTTLGLKEAKDLVDSAPKPVKEGATKDEADEIKKKLEAAGATVELK